MMASYDWRVRSAGLMAIAAIGEGTGKVMQNELGKVIEYVALQRHHFHRLIYLLCNICV